MQFNKLMTLSIAILSVVGQAVAQTISGSTSVTSGSTVTYTYNDGTIYSSGAFSFTNQLGTVTTTRSGSVYTGTATFTGTGTTMLLFNVNGGTQKAYLSITISCPGVPTPYTNFMYTNSCGSSNIYYTIGPPTGVTWYWQTSATGTSTTYSSSTYTVTSAGTYYIRAYSSCNSVWSSSSLATSAVTVTPLPSAPSSTTPASICPSNTAQISAVAGAGGSSLNWYTVSTGGTSVGTGPSYTTPSLTTTTTYYVATYNSTTLCESSPRTAVTVTVYALPSAPSGIQASTNTCGSKTLSYSGAPPSGTNWYWQGITNSNGTDTSPTAAAATYIATASGPYYIRAQTSTGCWSTASTMINVAVNNYPATPNVPLSNSNTCGPVTLSYNGAPASGIGWYWQGTNSSGQDNSSASATGSTYTASTAGTTNYYIAAQNQTSGCWSTAPAAISVTVNAVPNTPDPIVASSNACGPKTLSYGGTPPAGTSWYWQGVLNPNGTDTSPTAAASTYSVSTNGAYFLRAKTNAGCWSSSSAAINITIGAFPSPPPSQGTVPGFCEWDMMSVTAVPTSGTAKWYTSANTFLYLGNTYSPTNLNFGSYTYNVTTVDGNGCESTSSTPYSLTVNANCDLRMNWDETISYTYTGPTDVIGTVASDAKVYSDGFGNPIQSQVKSLSNNQVLASESIYDRLGSQTLNTLPAPINSNSFVYRYRFTTNTAGQKYSSTDFDIPPQNNAAGEVNNPNPVSNNGLGTLGWYYSSANNMEPNTPITAYPYSRTYATPGPNPTSSKSAAPGDAYKMGSGHESKSDRSLILPGELNHYYTIKDYFVPSTDPVASTVNVSSFSGKYIFSGTGSTTVVPGTSYTFSVTGYTGAQQAYLYVGDGNSNGIVWQGPAFPIGASGTVSVNFSVPTGVTSVKLAVLWPGSSTDNMTISGFTFGAYELPTSTSIGYKYISTDPDGKQSVQFVDAGGMNVASAMVTSALGVTPITYDYWTYNFYNDLGQLIASVAPNGVVVGNTGTPNFVTKYKYDHLGRLIETTSPDEGTSQFLYSTDGKIRFSQNQEQRTAVNKRFSYTNYDYLGRLIESGEYTYATTGDYAFDAAYASPLSTNSVVNLVDNVGYTGVTSPGNDPHYSDVTFIQYDLPATDFPSDPVHPQQNNLIGQVSRTKNANATTWYSYDEFGHVEWTIQSINTVTASQCAVSNVQ
ncbi:MAG: hypothetical protein JSS79_07550 [Bacteroidetes bacterium]|nr:hypothetical protein [Bacteroidota bacterium]